MGLSLRLRDALALLLGEREAEPSPEDRVLAGIDAANFRHREWRRTLGRTGICHRAYKDTRDTYASHLLTAGIALGGRHRGTGSRPFGASGGASRAFE